MSTNPSIAEVVVEGLHDQFDFEIKLLPGLKATLIKSTATTGKALH